MGKLLKMNREELEEEYFWTFGSSADNQDKDRIIAALYYGKRIQYLTQEEINQIEEL